MFAVIYRIYLKKGKEKEYQREWKIVSDHFVKYRGAIAATLHRGEKGLWVIYSRWPDRKTRDASWPNGKLPKEIQESVKIMKELTERRLPEICMEIISEGD